jgi:hypothetical protein
MTLLKNYLIAYALLFAFICSCSTILAKAMEFMMFPQYTCNFIHGIIITLYALENWSLLSDLKYNQVTDHTRSDENSHNYIIKELSLANKELSDKNIQLKDEITILREKERLLNSKQNLGISHWKRKWDSRLNPRNESIPNSTISVPISPPIKSFRISVPAVPAIAPTQTL